MQNTIVTEWKLFKNEVNEQITVPRPISPARGELLKTDAMMEESERTIGGGCSAGRRLRANTPFHFGNDEDSGSDVLGRRRRQISLNCAQKDGSVPTSKSRQYEQCGCIAPGGELK